jgi:hypothetical protein
MLYDQDGSVFMIDWYDANQCHHNNVDGHDRSNGRIFKLVYGDHKGTQIDLGKKTNEELAQLLSNKNQFIVRHARRVLQERNAGNEIAATLIKQVKSDAPASQRLQSLWALGSLGQINNEIGLQFLKDGDAYIRAWTIQFLAENKNVSAEALKEFATMAKADPSPVVRLYLASALQRVAPEKRWDVLAGLVAHQEDTGDHNLPLMYWYAAEGSVAGDKTKAIQLMAKSKIPKLRQFITRRIASDSKPVAVK